jgi:hypothetical protein
MVRIRDQDLIEYEAANARVAVPPPEVEYRLDTERLKQMKQADTIRELARNTWRPGDPRNGGRGRD